MNRRRFAWVAVLVMVLIGLILPPASADDPPPGEYTYAQLQALGIYTGPTPAEVGLPSCTTADPDWEGFATAEEAEAAVTDTDAASCMVDPADVTYWLGMPEPHSGPPPQGYHHAGMETNAKYQGGRVAVEVGNPAVCHQCPGPGQQFVVARTFAKILGKWIEVGWGEISWLNDNRHVYTFASQTDMWRFYFNFHLTHGRYYVFRARDCAAGCAEIWWNGVWRLLQKATDFRCMNQNGTNNCFQEVYLEIYSGSGVPEEHPSMNAAVDGVGVNFKNAKLRTAPSTYYLWSDSSYPSMELQVSPYVVCWINRDWNFRAGKNLSC